MLVAGKPAIAPKKDAKSQSKGAVKKSKPAAKPKATAKTETEPGNNATSTV